MKANGMRELTFSELSSISGGSLGCLALTIKDRFTGGREGADCYIDEAMRDQMGYDS